MSAPDFRQIIEAIVKTQPSMSVGMAVELADAIGYAAPFDVDDPQHFGEWAKRQPEVARYLSEVPFTTSSKIHAIKELRTLTTASLKQAKDAIEAVA